MEFQNITAYDRKTLTVMNQVLDRMVHGRQPTAFRMVRIVFPLLLLLGGVYLLAVRGVDLLAVVSILVGGLILFWMLCIHQFRALMASLIAVKGAPKYRMDFSQEGYEITYPTPEGEESSGLLDYDTIWAACQTQDYFVLQVGRQQGYALRRDGFTKGDAEEFSRFLSGQTGEPVPLLKL